MGVAILEHEAPADLITLLDSIKNDPDSWGVATVRRDYLRTLTNEAFSLAINPIMQAAAQAHVFYLNERSIYIVWNGRQKAICMNLRSFICTSLMRAGLNVSPHVMISYTDPHCGAEKIRDSLGVVACGTPDSVDGALFSDSSGEWEEKAVDNATSAALKATREQIDSYWENRNRKAHRKQLQLLVVEDQVFSLKLLCEILRGVRVRGYAEAPTVETAAGIHEGWRIFLKHAPDIAFVDLNLADGSGHSLVRAIKNADVKSCVIVVTANNYEEELGVARQNNVEGFIAKPYNKKQILDCILTYVATLKPGREKPSMDMAVDFNNLREITGGDAGLEAELFRQFLASSADCMKALQAAFDGSDEETWRKQAHAFKGISLNLGANELGALCKKAQEGYQATAEEKRNLLGAIAHEYGRVRTEIESHL